MLVGVRATLTWHIRMKIALDAAKGLAFLHAVEKPIIYRDFKTSNILLDEVSQMPFGSEIVVLFIRESTWSCFYSKHLLFRTTQNKIKYKGNLKLLANSTST